MKEKIVNAAIALFIEKGIENVKTRDLTEHLAISRSHIYHYFTNWQALCVESISTFLDNELHEFVSRTASLPASDRLQAFIDGVISPTPDPTARLYGSLWQLAAHNPVYAQMMDAILTRWHEALVAIIVAGENEGVFRHVNASRVARQLDSMLFGYSDHLYTLPSDEAFRQAQDDIDDFIRGNLLAQERRGTS
ncbi:TetR/AcrR family transcriptional regulator [Cronobacter dublinensis]|uniref:TetR/AcrR family transcriptional regulator n=1 Tax=Cronobacter dublinensis TaxID=413497 RepID=UPI0003A0127A|nr:TetR/AcrR family transcriptional regulator [Cronobacter dublinensis]MDI6428122.1 TetR/AcrR family transcriptional regulator [Cronobacter dublinensis]